MARYNDICFLLITFSSFIISLFKKKKKKNVLEVFNLHKALELWNRTNIWILPEFGSGLYWYVGYLLLHIDIIMLILRVLSIPLLFS